MAGPTSNSPPPTVPSSPTPSSSSPSQQPTLLDAFSTISPLSDLQKLPSIPCARYSLLFGILAGVSVGSLRFLFSRGRGRASVGSAANWAVGTWGVGSLGAWEVCRRRQTSEQARMHALITEVKQRRAAKKSDKGVGGVLVGEHGRELIRRKEEEKGGGGGGGWWDWTGTKKKDD